MTQTINRRWIYLPVEVKARELIPKLFLGSKAIKAGFGLILGRNGMNISRDKFPKGIYFDKCLSKHKIAFHEYQVNTLGNRLVSFDEEGLLFASDEIYVNNRLTQRSIDLSKLIFLWGKEQERVIKKKFSVEEKLIVSGGPRLDIWRPEFASLNQLKINELKERYGKFVLVVSNWGYQSNQKKEGLDPHAVYPGILITHIRSAFITLITKLSNALPNRTIIVRPHPLDLPDYWKAMSEKFPKNVTVIFEDSISPWVRAAHAVIHNDCTTGLEGWIGNALVFAYYPEFKEFKEYSTFTMPVNQLGVVCRTPDELIRRVSGSFSNDTARDAEKNSTQNIMARQYLHIENNRYASDYIIEKLQDLNVAEESYRVPSYGVLKKLRAAWGSLKWRANDTLGKSGMYTLPYSRQKNAGIVYEEIREILEKLSPIVGVDESFFNIKEVDKDTFCIFGEKGLEHHK